VAGNVCTDQSFNFNQADDVVRLAKNGNVSYLGAIWVTNTDGVVVSDNTMTEGFGDDGGAGTVAAIQVDDCNDGVVADNAVYSPFTGGLYLSNSNRMTVQGNNVASVETNFDDFYDNYQIDGDGNTVIGNKSSQSAGATNSARYGLNIAGGNNNAVYANDLDDLSNYATADSVDSGTGTQTSPAAGTIGGQFGY
jgi:parallel beta-helix repeat protein